MPDGLSDSKYYRSFRTNKLIGIKKHTPLSTSAILLKLGYDAEYVAQTLTEWSIKGNLIEYS